MNGWHNQVQCHLLKKKDRILGLALTGQYGTEAGHYCTIMKDDLASQIAQLRIGEEIITFVDREEHRLSFEITKIESILLKVFTEQDRLFVYNTGLRQVGFKILDSAVNPNQKQEWTTLASLEL